MEIREKGGFLIKITFINLTIRVCFLQSLSRPLQLSQQGRILEVAIEAAADAVIGMMDNLNDWDSKVGDGDCGSTVSCTLKLS